MVVANPPILRKLRMTEQEFLRLPQDGKYELVEGEAKRVPAAHEHDIIGAVVIYWLTPASIGRGYIASAQAGFRMKDGNIRCPDVSFMSKSRLPGGKPSKGFGNFAPDLCIEIISPSEELQEMEDKVQEYFDAGAQQVWHLFPETQRLRLFTSPNAFTDLASTDTIDGGNLLPTFRCQVSELFSLTGSA